MFLAKYLNTKTWGMTPVKKQLHGNNLNPRTLCSMQIPQGAVTDSYEQHRNQHTWEGQKQAPNWNGSEVLKCRTF